jgi:hypothetical protein
MSMRSRILVLFSTVLVGQAACDDDNNNVNTDGGLIADGGGIIDGRLAGDGGLTTEGGLAGDARGDGGGDAAGGAGDAAGDAGAGDAVAAATFTQVYSTIISQRCMPCHTTATGIGVTMGKLDMTSQAAAFMNLVNTQAAGVACTGKGPRVLPGMPDSSIMYLKVSPDDPTPCGSKMPLGTMGLSKAEADMIEGWIMAGAKND